METLSKQLLKPFPRKMNISNQNPIVNFNQLFAIFVSLFSICIIAALVIIRTTTENQNKRARKSTLCCFGSENSDETETLQRRYPGSSLPSDGSISNRQSRYSDDEFYINHASQTQSIVKLDQIENCNFIYV